MDSHFQTDQPGRPTAAPARVASDQLLDGDGAAVAARDDRVRIKPRRHGTLTGAAIVTGVAVVLGIVFSGDDYNLQLAANALALGLWVMALDVLVGFAGLVSFGHVVWLGVGAYASGYLFLQGWDLLTAAVATIGIVAVLASVLGWVATRTGGLAFAIITLAEGIVVYTVIIHLDFLGSGVGLFGVPFPKIAGQTVLDTQQSLYFFALAMAVGGYLLLRWVMNAPFGGFTQAVRDDETRARSVGISVTRQRVSAFVVSAVVGAMGGLVFVVVNGGIGPSQIGWDQSGLALVVLIIGGVATLYGGVVGAFIYVFASSYLATNFATTWQIYLGGLFVILVLVMPGGLAAAVRNVLRLVKRGAA